MINWGNVFQLLVTMGVGIFCWELGKFITNYLTREKQEEKIKGGD